MIETKWTKDPEPEPPIPPGKSLHMRDEANQAELFFYQYTQAAGGDKYVRLTASVNYPPTLSNSYGLIDMIGWLERVLKTLKEEAGKIC